MIGISLKMPAWAYDMLTKDDNMQNPFKVGDVLMCLRGDITGLTSNKLYTHTESTETGYLSRLSDRYVYLSPSEMKRDGIRYNGFDPTRFRLATPQEMIAAVYTAAPSSEPIGMLSIPKTDPGQTVKPKKGGKVRVIKTTAESLTLRNLQQAEELFLRAHGWSKVRGGLYRAPKGYQTNSVDSKSSIDRRHAVNSQMAMLGRK